MPTAPTCTSDDHRNAIAMTYSHTAPQPDGYRLIYECPACGATDGIGATMAEHRRAEYGEQDDYI